MSDTFQSVESMDGKISPADGVIHGVCVIKIGEAKGHGVFVDHRTLETAIQSAEKHSEGVKVMYRHDNSGEYQNVLEDTFGLIRNFSIEGDKLRGDLHLLKSLPKEIKEKAFEMAERMPSQFGLSIKFRGVNEDIGGKPFLRCKEIQSIDLTTKPAATDGLFSMKTIKYESGDSGKHAKDCECSECERREKDKKYEDLSAAVQSLTATVTKLSEKLDASPAKVTPAPVVTQVSTTALEFTDAEGKVSKLEASDIFKRLEAADRFVAEAKKSVETTERTAVINKLIGEGRVVFKDDGVAYKLEELQSLSLDFIKFAARNSQVLPTAAKATYSGTTSGPGNDVPNFTKTVIGADGAKKVVPLVGDELTSAAWEAKYGDIDKMVAESTRKN